MEFEQLQAIIADVLNVNLDEINPDSTFVDDFGADSLDIAQIMMGVEDELGVDIDPSEMDDIVTVSDALNKIRAALAANE